MFRKCVVDSCSSIKDGDGIVMHTLPSEPTLQSAWIQAILQLTGQTINSDDLICSKHFTVNSLGLPELSAADNVPDLGQNAFSNKRCKVEDEKKPSKKPRREVSSETRRCCWYNCANNSKDNSRLQFFPFPSDPLVRDKWEECCSERDIADKYICSHHFAEEFFLENSSTGDFSLRADAVPNSVKKECEIDLLDNSALFTIVEVQPNIDTPPVHSLGQECSANKSTIQSNSKSRKYCNISSCASNSRSRGIKLHPIPKEASLSKIWLQSIASSFPQSDVSRISHVCSLHFEKDFIEIDATGKTSLSAKAVPTIFKESNDFPAVNWDHCSKEQFLEFYQWSLKRNEEYSRLKRSTKLQAKRLALLAKSIDEFKAKRFVSEEANAALQILFDKVIDTQYPM